MKNTQSSKNTRNEVIRMELPAILLKDGNKITFIRITIETGKGITIYYENAQFFQRLDDVFGENLSSAVQELFTMFGNQITESEEELISILQSMIDQVIN